MGTLSMSTLSFSVINWPLCVCNIIANFFFAFCIICRPSNIDGPKQPVKILLESLVCCNTVYLLFLIGFKFVDHDDGMLLYVTLGILYYTVSTSMSTSVWLAFFYFTQIVPVKMAFFIWAKKNITSIIYAALVFDRLFFLFVLTLLLLLSYDIPVLGLACYLQRNIRSMSAAGCLFSPRLDSQIRVTITGILQGVLFLLCHVYILISYYTNMFTNVFIDLFISYTVISIYVTGTTINLGVGQTLFRQRPVYVCSKMRKLMTM
ncbi:uncharacterized protein LOC134016987 [Osmerus eperlanus]|uniref:uncharacterized protein LOC134016987 n=1 Tax=Osmerus eperlanus TaxID=29151 RepID=UPI002E11F1F0